MKCLNTKKLLAGSLGALFAVIVPSVAMADGEKIKVYKSPTCGCCAGWVEHMEESGFHVDVQDMDDLSMIKQLGGVPDHLQACHTAVINGYTVEGHVPASAVTELLDSKPAIRGIAVPGMPQGSPGMPSPMHDTYDVVTFGENGEQLFATYKGDKRANR